VDLDVWTKGDLGLFLHRYIYSVHGSEIAKERLVKKSMRELGERSLAVAVKLLDKGGEEQTVDYLMQLDKEEFVAVSKVNNDSKMRRFIMTAKVKNQQMELQRGLALLQEWLALGDEELQKTFVSGLTEENKSLLERTYWANQSTGAASLHLLQCAVVPTPKRAVLSVAGGGLGAAGAGAAGASLTGVVLTGISSALLVDVVLTGLEEDEATKKVGKTLRAWIVDKPKNLLVALFSKKKEEPSVVIDEETEVAR
jgi:hypothetical protein